MTSQHHLFLMRCSLAAAATALAFIIPARTTLVQGFSSLRVTPPPHRAGTGRLGGVLAAASVVTHNDTTTTIPAQSLFRTRQSQVPSQRVITRKTTIAKPQKISTAPDTEGRKIAEVTAPSVPMVSTLPVHTFPSMWDCLEFLGQHDQGDAANDEYYVIKYFASYCKVCQRASINYKKIASEYAPKDSSASASGRNVFFLRADAGEWATPPSTSARKARKKQQTGSSSSSSSEVPSRLKDLQALGISKFPFVQIYQKTRRKRGLICVASFSTGASHLFSRRVRETLQSILQRSPSEWDDFYQQFQTEISENACVRKELLLAHQQQRKPLSAVALEP